MSTYVLQPRQSELESIQLVVASSSHQPRWRFTQFVLDYLDFKEYINDGRTLHGKAHIIFLYKGLEEDPTQTTTVLLLKCRCSSLLSPKSFHLKENHRSLKDRQRSRSLVGVETEPKLPVVCLAEPLDHLSTVWNLVDGRPTVPLENLKANCSAPTGVYSRSILNTWTR